MDSITPASQGVHKRSDDTTNHEAIEQFEEQGPSYPKRKRAHTQMPSVHGRKERKIIILNEYNQPVGPTKEVVKELGSYQKKRRKSLILQILYQAEIERIQSTQESEDGSHSVDAFASVMGPEHPGHVRLYGRGVTKTVLKGQKGNLGSSLADERMQRKMEEMEESMQQKMHEKLNEQKDAMEQNITMNVITRLQRLNPDLRLDPDMLRFNARLPVYASSTQQGFVQLNNRSSAGSNNQGGVDQEMDDEDDEELDLT